MTINITWTPRERDVVLQMAVYLYKHGRLRFDRPTHNEAWRKAIHILPVNRRRNFTSASNLGRIYELYMGMLTDEVWVNLPREIAGHRKLEFPDYMVLADRIDLDMIQRFGASLDTAVHVPRQKKLSPQEQMEFLYKEIERLQKQVMDLTHAFETHTHGSSEGQQWSHGNHEQAEARADRPNDYVSLVRTEAQAESQQAEQKTRYCIRKAGTSNEWEEVPYDQWFNMRTSVHYETRAFDGAIPTVLFGGKPRLEIVKGRTEGGELVLTDRAKRLHELYPMHAPAVVGNTALEPEAEGDGIGDDPGAQYDPENYSDMEPEPIVVGNVTVRGDLGVTAVMVDAPALVVEPVHKDFDPIRDNHGVFDDTGPILYCYGLPSRLRALLDHYVKARAPHTKVNIIHLDEGGKTPVGDVAMVVINPWMDTDRPSARIKLIERNVTKPRYVESGWASITDGVRAALAEHYGMFITE